MFDNIWSRESKLIIWFPTKQLDFNQYETEQGILRKLLTYYYKLHIGWNLHGQGIITEYFVSQMNEAPCKK